MLFSMLLMSFVNGIIDIINIILVFGVIETILCGLKLKDATICSISEGVYLMWNYKFKYKFSLH